MCPSEITPLVLLLFIALAGAIPVENPEYEAASEKKTAIDPMFEQVKRLTGIEADSEPLSDIDEDSELFNEVKRHIGAALKFRKPLNGVSRGRYRQYFRYPYNRKLAMWRAGRRVAPSWPWRRIDRYRRGFDQYQPANEISEDKRHIGAALNARYNTQKSEKRHIGAALNAARFKSQSKSWPLN